MYLINRSNFKTFMAFIVTISFIFFLFKLNTTQQINLNDSLSKTIIGEFIHITDPNYIIGGSSKTQCHKLKSKSKSSAGKFGYLGSRCDSPNSLVESTFSFIKENFNNLDFIFDTGDAVRHTRDKDIDITIEEIFSDFRTVVANYQTLDLNKIQVIPTIGNNDMVPHNLLSPIDSKYFNQLATIWKPFNIDFSDTFIKFGYFFKELIPKKLTVLSLNTMTFFKKNELSDKCGKGSSGKIQLDWMENLLKKIKITGSKAVIIGHVPPNDKKGNPLYFKKCYARYVEILGQFHETIIADTLSVVVKNNHESSLKYELITINPKNKHKVKNLNIVTVLTNGPSIIPVHNPSFRLYKYTLSENYNHTSNNPHDTLVSYTQYSADIKKSNDIGNLSYYKEYDTYESYKLTDLSNKNWSAFIKSFNEENSNNWFNYLRTLKFTKKFDDSEESNSDEE